MFWAVFGGPRKGLERLEPSVRQFGQNMGSYPSRIGGLLHFSLRNASGNPENRVLGGPDRLFGLFRSPKHGFETGFPGPLRRGVRNTVLGVPEPWFWGSPEGPQNGVENHPSGGAFSTPFWGSQNMVFSIPKTDRKKHDFWGPKTMFFWGKF